MKKGDYMLITLLKSKIQRAKVTQCNMNYEGSLGLDEAFLELSGLKEYEKVLVANLSNGERFETYVIREAKNSGKVSLYGAAARLGEIGDKLIILSFCLVPYEEADAYRPKVVYLDDMNIPKT
jgi:aspartate 1-decarboxylase